MFLTGRDAPINEVIKGCDYLKEVDGEITLEKKHMYYAQVQTNMAILNLQNCDFVVYSSFEDEYKCIDVKFDLKFTTTLLFKLKNIYFEKMIHNICVKNV